MVALFLYHKRRDVSGTRTAEGGICKKSENHVPKFGTRIRRKR